MTPPNPRLSRRRFLQSSAAASTIALASTAQAQTQQPAGFSNLKPLGDRVYPITADEFHARLLHAQELMPQLDPKFDALLIGPGTSLYYFTGIRWWLSARLLALVLPRTGQPLLISPAFEEARMRELMRYPLEVRVWQEDESPTKLRAAAPAFECVSADLVTIACRAVKSPHELELMRLACEATCDVYREAFLSLKEGVSEEEGAHFITAGYARMNLRGYALVLFGSSAALPHGSRQAQKLKEGDVVLIDGGCTVDGYESDVTRTGVLGKPSEKIQRVYEIVRKAQDAALDSARAGKFSGAVDDAARGVITTAGYGPDYKFFTHRLGHGICLDVHTPPY